MRYPLAEPIYDWFMLLLVFLKESLDDKNTWIGVLCDSDEKYDGAKINAYILSLATDSPLQLLFVELQRWAGRCASFELESGSASAVL